MISEEFLKQIRKAYAAHSEVFPEVSLCGQSCKEGSPDWNHVLLLLQV